MRLRVARKVMGRARFGFEGERVVFRGPHGRPTWERAKRRWRKWRKRLWRAERRWIDSMAD